MNRIALTLIHTSDILLFFYWGEGPFSMVISRPFKSGDPDAKRVLLKYALRLGWFCKANNNRIFLCRVLVQVFLWLPALTHQPKEKIIALSAF